MPRPRGPLHRVLMTWLPTETRGEEEQDGTQGNFYNPPLDVCHVLVIDVSPKVQPTPSRRRIKHHLLKGGTSRIFGHI